MLLLFIAGTLAGRVLQDENGALSFTYEPSHSGPPVSLSVRIEPTTYPKRVIRPHLMGLPDDSAVRADSADPYGCPGENPFAPPSRIGLDCHGAVQLVPEEAARIVENRSGSLAEVRDTDLEERLPLARTRLESAGDKPYGSVVPRWRPIEDGPQIPGRAMV